jgi:hypothetical protein
MAVEDVYELAYREAVRALEHQRTTLSELRSRASMLLAAASIATSLLGQEAFRGMGSAGWAALSGFALLTTCVMVIVWPDKELTFETDLHALLADQLSSEQPTLSELSLGLITQMSLSRHVNAHRLARAIRIFRVGIALLAIQMVLTVTAAGGIF